LVDAKSSSAPAIKQEAHMMAFVVTNLGVVL